MTSQPPALAPEFPPRAPTAGFPYQIGVRVGEGGMGIVYKALEPALGRPVAIKVLREELLPAGEAGTVNDSRARFVREARAAAALSHPGATTIYRVGEEHGRPFIAMEWLEGQTLEALLQEGRPTAAEVVRLGVALLDTLAVAHAAGVVHRDIKPANLMVLRDGRLKVTDFGIARYRGPDLAQTQVGSFMGSPRFASPEQLLGEEVDGRSDLFSVGVVLYLALTERPPFEGRGYVELAQTVLGTEPKPLRDIEPSIPAGLEAVVLRALSKRREARHASAAEMASDLRAFAGATDAGSSSISWTPRPAVLASLEASPRPTLLGLPHDTPRLVARVLEGWPGKPLGSQDTRQTLDRLMEAPLHAPPFAGAVRFERTVVLLHGGCVLGALEAGSRRSGDEALEALPAEAETTLFPVPSLLPAAVVPLLGTLLRPPVVRHGQLDSSFASLPALAGKLSEERFDGVLRLRRGKDLGLVVLSAGQQVLALYSEGWDGIPVAEPWESWVGSQPIQASVEEQHAPPAQICFRRALRDLEVQVDRADRSLSVACDVPGSARQDPARTTTIGIRRGPGPTGLQPDPSCEGDVALRLLRFMLQGLPEFLAERGRAERWKFLAEWLPLVRSARLHHDLPRPGSRESDLFDLVTFDEAGKVLHLAQRVARATPRNVAEFVERVKLAKGARLKGGDIGAAILVAPAFDMSTVSAYRGATLVEKTSRWSFEDALTRYEGFVRMGPRRGFHLLLVSESPSSFEPILPG